MQPGKQQKKHNPKLAFHLMKFAVQDFQKNCSSLTKDEYTQAYQHANEEMLLHQVILGSSEACCVIIPDSILERTLRAVISEYPSDEAFHIMLDANDLRLSDYTQALHNDLRVETILGKIASSVQTVTHPEIVAYYNNNRTQFCHLEQRNTSLIQLFANSSSNTDPALAIINGVHERLSKYPENFANEAKKHSECDTGQDGGEIGILIAGELCHELDATLFSLNKGEISQVIKSANAYHILKCTAIYPAIDIPFKEATAQIRPLLLKKKQLNACRIWLQDLVQGTDQD